MFYIFLKRPFDCVCSGVGLLLLLPVGLVAGLLIKLCDGGPIFYSQIRIGQFGVPFRIWKFRTMVVNAERLGPGITKDGDPRIIRIGRFLRKTKLDELPQLWNVLRGEMSLVGPRPEVPGYVAKYTPEQRKVLALQPGITDLATLEFRNEEEMLRAESRKQKAESRNAEGGAGDGKAEMLRGEMLKSEMLKGEQGAENGRRKTEDGGRKTEDGGLKTEDGRGKTEDGGGYSSEVEKFYVEYCLPQKIHLNLAYASRASVWEDTKLILRTVWALGARRSAQDGGRRTEGSGLRNYYESVNKD